MPCHPPQIAGHVPVRAFVPASDGAEPDVAPAIDLALPLPADTDTHCEGPFGEPSVRFLFLQGFELVAKGA
jgi:hypothetical protein